MRGRTSKAALLVFGLGTGLAITELVARALDLKPQSLRGKRYLLSPSDAVSYHCYPSNPHGEMSPLPDTSQGPWRLLTTSLTELPLAAARETPWCVEDRLSDQSLRDRHFDLQPPGGRTRVAMVGDSFVRGEGVPVELGLPRQVETLLGTDRYEVANVGFVGVGTASEVITVREAMARLNASRVMLVFVPNDVRVTPELERRQQSINDLINIRAEEAARHDATMWYSGGPRVLHLAGSAFEMRRISRETVQWYLDSYDPAINEPGLRQLAADFRALAEVPGGRVVVALYPLMFGLEGDYPLAPIHARVAQMVKDAGLPVLDLAPAFRGQSTRSLQVHPADHHPNGKAHGVAARALASWLTRDQASFLAPSAP
jgi:hypothetical protein